MLNGKDEKNVNCIIYYLKVYLHENEDQQSIITQSIIRTMLLFRDQVVKYQKNRNIIQNKKPKEADTTILSYNISFYFSTQRNLNNTLYSEDKFLEFIIQQHT